MTVNQFLLDRYVGKYVSFIIEERKWKDEDKPKSDFHHFDSIYCHEWEERTKYIEKKEYKYLYRQVRTTDKIVNIEHKGHGWVFKTLKGYTFKFNANDELDIIEHTSIPVANEPRSEAQLMREANDRLGKAVFGEINKKKL